MIFFLMNQLLHFFFAEHAVILRKLKACIVLLHLTKATVVANKLQSHFEGWLFYVVHVTYILQFSIQTSPIGMQIVWKTPNKLGSNFF